MHYFLGLDNGGTTTKAAIFDEGGMCLGICGTDTQGYHPAPGYAERDMEEMWEANCRVIQGVLQKTGLSGGEIAGIGVCGHGKGMYLWGNDEKPLGMAIMSTDNRAYRYADQWAKDGTESKAFQLSCQHVMSCQPVALLAWLKDNEPERYQKIRWIFSCKDYIRFRLTGEAYGEITDFSGSNFLNLNTGDYDDRLLELFGIPEVKKCLPPLRKSLDICGRVTEEAAIKTGLLSGTPVIGGMFDIDACALGVGLQSEEDICMIAGTWSINEYIRKTPVMDGKVRMNSLFAVPGYYLVEESSPTSAGNHAWFLQQMMPEAAKECGSAVYEKMNAWVESIPAEEFVPVFLPFIMGSNVHPNAKGSFVGITANHTRKHILRGIYEGITFCHRMHVDKLMATRENPPHLLRLAGGAAKSPVWSQMFADVMKVPVATVNSSETGTLGCAVAVSVAVGTHKSLAEAMDKMCGISAIYYPDPDRAAVYDRKYKLYCRTVDCLNGLWGEMQQYCE